MIYIHSSKISSIIGYNKYTKNDDYIDLFFNYLYKNRDDLKIYDIKNNNNVNFMSDEEKTNNLLSNINDDSTNKIHDLLNTDITNNKTLLQNTTKLNSLINNSDISQSDKKNIKHKLESKINCNYGINTENKAIRLYEQKTNNKVYDCNIKLYTLNCNKYYICGKLDGLVDIDEKQYLVEIKNRKNLIFDIIPQYEKIQLITYTKLCNCDNIVFIQCINEKISIKQLNKYSDEKLWKIILLRLEIYIDLINKLQNDNDLRATLLNSNQQYTFLKKYLNWL